VNEEKGGGDNVGMEYVVVDWLRFVLCYRWSNRGLLRETAGRPHRKGRCGYHILLRRGLRTGGGMWCVVSEAAMSHHVGQRSSQTCVEGPRSEETERRGGM
jgi:hypothetical protein